MYLVPARVRAAALIVGAATAGVLLAGAPAAAAAPAPLLMAGPSESSAAAGQAGTFVPLAVPGRVLSGRLLHGGSTASVPVAGHGGVPSDGVGSVVVAVTAAHATTAGSILAYSRTRSRASTVQFAPGAASTATTIVPLDGSGAIHLADGASGGTVRASVDVLGWYRAGTPSATNAGIFHPVHPARVVAPTVLESQQRMTPLLGGTANVPAGAGAVAVTITATKPAAAGEILADGGSVRHPTSAVVHFAAKQAVSGFAVLPLAGNRISLVNSSSRSVHVAVDVVGYYTAGVPDSAAAYGTLAPTPVAGKPLRRGATAEFQVGGRAGVPKRGTGAVLATVHAVNPAAAGSLAAWRPGRGAPAAESLVSFAAHRTAATTAFLPVSGGKIALRNNSGGAVTVQLDVRGYVPSAAVPSPAGTATARYLDGLDDSTSAPDYLTSDTAQLRADGCADAQNALSFVLLDIGAQSVTGPQLSPQQPGVALALSSPTRRLTYAELRQILGGYLAGYADHHCNATGSSVELALGTNNDGSFTGQNGYAAKPRGADWANRLVDPLETAAKNAGGAVRVVGADDIEAAFASTEAQAQLWENAYLANTAAPLIENGDANSCPTTFGVTGKTCAFGWTQQQYYDLSHGPRTEALPQIFFPAEAVKWANIDLTGGGDLTFAGALTEHARVPSQLPASQGRAALYRALSAVVAGPAVDYAVDLEADSS